MVAKIAQRQHGVVTIAQLRWAGLSAKQVTLRVKAGRLHRLHRGVYAVGHLNLSREGKWMAAVLACGEGAALSHESAAHLWNRSPTSPPFSHVTVPGRNGRRRREGIRLHYSSTLTPKDVTKRNGIAVTTPARTAADLGWVNPRSRSDLERDFLALLRAHGLPMPEVNAKLGPYEVDFLWRAERLAVEVDSYAYHSDRATFVKDRARDRYLTARRFTPMRFADEELDETPDAIVEALRDFLRLGR